MKPKITMKHLEYFREAFPEGFEGCSNSAEFKQRLSWRENGFLMEALTGEASATVSRELEVMKEFYDFLYRTYVTTYCNHPHYIENGHPIDHECIIIPPEALRAEMEGDYQKAISLMPRPCRI